MWHGAQQISWVLPGHPRKLSGIRTETKGGRGCPNYFCSGSESARCPEGTFFNGNGYFLDFSVLSDKTGYLCHLMPDDRRPGHVYQPIAEPINDTSWTVYAKLLRILKDVDGGVLILKSASFDGEVYYHDGKLQTRRFNITELDTN